MAGAKATESEKRQILDLVTQGHNIEEIQGRFPHIDGRVISGLHMRHTRKASSPETLPPPAPLPTTLAAPPGPAPAPPLSSPMPIDRNLTPQQEAADATGFTPASQASHTPGGFRPSYREYMVVKKLDPPGDGVMKNEYPPFGINELLDRYAPGDYEIMHYREGRLFNTYREKIAPKPVSPAIGGVTREPARPDGPADTFMKAIDVYHRMHTTGKQEETVARAQEAAARVETERAKAGVEQAATVGLIDLVKASLQPKQSTTEPTVDKFFALMAEDRKAGESKLKTEIELMRERAKIDLELERERARAEVERYKAESEEKIKRERLFIEKMQEIDKARQDLWKESYDNMVEELKGMQASMSAELNEKKEWLKQYTELQQKHTDEVIKIKKELANGGDSLEMAKIIKDGVVQGLDRVGARLDMLAENGVIGKGKVENPAEKRAIGGGTVTAAPAGDGKESKAVMTKEAITEALKEKWFQDLQDEISRTVRRRVKAVATNQPKPHGTLLAQTFIDQMNADISLRKYMHYLISRDWDEILVDVGPALKPENKEPFTNAEAVTWFQEFQSFLSMSWNASIGVR